MSSAAGRIGFIGLGVMGEPMCRNLALKSGATVAVCYCDSFPVGANLTHGGRRKPGV